MSARRWSADGPLALLAALSVLLLVAFCAFVARHAVPYDPLIECRTVEATAIARLTTVGLLLPLGVVAVMTLSAGLACAHQLWMTRRVLGRVLAYLGDPPARVRSLAARAGMDGHVDVVNDGAVFTFCHGYRQPRVCVSRGLVELLADDELLAVLRHEAHHCHHHDPLKILLSRTLASALAFLPAAGALRDAFLAGKELCADADATRRDGPLALARALVKLFGAERPTWPAGVLAIGAISPTEARVTQLIDARWVRPTLPSVMDWILSAALVAGIFGFSYGAAAAAQSAPVTTACATELASSGGVPLATLPMTRPDVR